MNNTYLENHTIELVSAANVSHTRILEIKEIIGNGASCIAYKAIDAGSGLPVIVKECYPRSTASREMTGAVSWKTMEDETSAKNRFRSAFEVQRKIQSADETMNTNVHLIDGLYEGNNTLYSVSDIQNAKTFDATKDSSLQETLITARAIARAVGQFHALGFLHLDIKPQNILILPETRDIVKLLDFDSVIQKSDVSRPGVSISYTHEYAAPELLQGKRSKLCEATDIYSVGAVVFSRIMGSTPNADDRGTFSDWDLSDNRLFR